MLPSAALANAPATAVAPVSCTRVKLVPTAVGTAAVTLKFSAPPSVTCPATLAVP